MGGGVRVEGECVVCGCALGEWEDERRSGPMHQASANVDQSSFATTHCCPLSATQVISLACANTRSASAIKDSTSCTSAAPEPKEWASGQTGGVRCRRQSGTAQRRGCHAPLYSAADASSARPILLSSPYDAMSAS